MTSITELNSLTRDIYQAALKVTLKQEKSAGAKGFTKESLRLVHSIPEGEMKELETKISTVAKHVAVLIAELKREEEENTTDFQQGFAAMMPEGDKQNSKERNISNTHKIAEDAVKPEALQSLFHLLNACFRFALHDDTKPFYSKIHTKILNELPPLLKPLGKIYQYLAEMIAWIDNISSGHIRFEVMGTPEFAGAGGNKALAPACREYFFGTDEAQDTKPAKA